MGFGKICAHKFLDACHVTNINHCYTFYSYWVLGVPIGYVNGVYARSIQILKVFLCVF